MDTIKRISIGITIFALMAGATPALAADVPSVTTLSASSVGETYGTLNAVANPNGDSTAVWFEWGTTQGLGFIAGSQSIGSGTTNISFFIALNFLQPNATYYFRAVARNNRGTTVGNILSFTTSPSFPGSLPLATTNSATGVSQNSAVLNGSVNPNGGYTTAWFEWSTSASLGNTTGTQSVGSGNGNTALSAGLTGLSSNTTYYFRTVAQNSAGTIQGSILSFTTAGGGSGNGAPFVNTNSANVLNQNSAVLNGSVNPNGGYTTAWFEWGNSYSLGNNTGFQNIGSGSGLTSYSTTLSGLSPNNTYYFRAVAQNSSGTNYGNILSFTTGGITQGAAPFVSTLPPNAVFQNSTILRGLVTPNGNATNAWIEWGVTASLGLRSSTQFIGNDQLPHEFQLTVNPLAPRTTYFFRAVGQNAFGTNYGAILSFTTPGSIVISPTPPAAPSSGGRALEPSLLLTPSADNTKPAPDEEITYTLTYENTSETNRITNLVARLTLPENMTFVSSDIPTLSERGRNIRLELENLEALEENSFSAKLKVATDVKSGDTLPVNAIVTYRDARGNTQSANAVLTITVTKGAGFLASLFSTLQIPIGWLIVIILAIFLLLIAYRRFLSPQDSLAK